MEIKQLSVFGGTGFVGSEFIRQTNNYTLIDKVPRDSSTPICKDVLYLISTTHNYNVFSDPHLDVNTNLTLLIRALENWRYHNATGGVFNFVSSWFVYGDGELPAKEDRYCNPKGFYSITKRAAEQLLISYCETYDLNYRILRLGNVIGDGDKNVSAKKNALQYLIQRMKDGQEIDVYEHGDFYRSYIHVEDCVRAIRLVMDKGEKNSIYNIGTSEPQRFIDMLEYAAKMIGYTHPFNFIEQKGFHKKVQAKSFYMDTTKLYSLGFKPQYTTETMLDSLLT